MTSLVLLLRFQRGLCLLVVLLSYIRLAATATTVKIVLSMICRNEEVNFKSNLAAWLPIIDYFVFVMDNRTTDNSVATIKYILKNEAIFRIIPHNFTGFGWARTLSLSSAWENFPHASHVLIADPDWAPQIVSMRKEDLADMDVDVFRFTAFDRNGITTRQMDWLLALREGLKMRYHLHEVLDIGEYRHKSIGWVVHEIEQPGTWHTAVGHGNSFGLKRYLFDIEMLEKDLPVYGHDPHSHYYLGVTHHAVYEKATKISSPIGIDLNYHFDQALKYLVLRATSIYQDEFIEERWGSMMLLGVLHAAKVL